MTAARFLIPRSRDLVPGRLNAVVLNRGTAAPLRGSNGLSFSVIHEFRVIEDDRVEGGPYGIATTQSLYESSTHADVEVLSFHWTPETRDPGQETVPHLHVGSAIVSARSPVLPKRFNKLHIPSGPVSIESVVRFLIVDLDVIPTTNDWPQILLQEGSNAIAPRILDQP